jgi:hypothetical protein
MVFANGVDHFRAVPVDHRLASKDTGRRDCAARARHASRRVPCLISQIQLLRTCEHQYQSVCKINIIVQTLYLGLNRVDGFLLPMPSFLATSTISNTIGILSSILVSFSLKTSNYALASADPSYLPGRKAFRRTPAKNCLDMTAYLVFESDPALRVGGFGHSGNKVLVIQAWNKQNSCAKR